MKVTREELYEIGERARSIRHEDYEMLSGLAATVERVRGYWKKAEADKEYRRMFGLALTLSHCESRWRTCKTDALGKIKLVRR